MTKYWFAYYQRFRILFNSLSKVLFIFPSRYLFAIDLSPVFSLQWISPPTSRSSPKERYSTVWSRLAFE